MHGKGLFRLPDGRTYEGEYANDRKHGRGIFTYSDGRKKEGFWQNGKQVKTTHMRMNKTQSMYKTGNSGNDVASFGNNSLVLSNKTFGVSGGGNQESCFSDSSKYLPM
jgi:hypothetical protein